MSTDEILDAILIPRPNGSAGLERVASYLGTILESNGAEVSLFPFTATPHGFQLVWTVALALMLLVSTAILTRRYALAIGLTLLTACILLLEFELLLSPVSGLLPATEDHVIGSYPGRPGGPTLIFTAHYDTTTHFGDHYSWGPWGWRQGPAVGLAVGVSLVGLWMRRRGRVLPRVAALLAAAAIPIPFAALFWFQSVGPLVREPSPGAIDNGGSVASLLLLSQALAVRDADSPTTVKLAFLAAEEERALGSWAYAKYLRENADPSSPVVVINLESIGASDDLGYIPQDGFALRRYQSPPPLVRFVNDAAQRARGAPLPARMLLEGILTDGRSFLAHGIPALTLRAFTGEEFPRRLHSAHDSRERVSTAAIESTAFLLSVLVQQSDSEPQRAARIGRVRQSGEMGAVN